MHTPIPYKVTVRLGQSEFQAEGPEATVKDQLAAFLEIARSQGSPHGNGNGNGNGQHDRTPSEQPTGQESHTPERRDQLVGRLFTVDRNEIVSLRVLPGGECRIPNSLILILYGYRALRDQNEVTGADLLQGAKQSGLPVTSRVDRALEGCEEYVIKGGANRWSRYMLTNPGVAFAEALMNEMNI